MKTPIAAALGAVGLLIAGPVQAHHAFVMFDLGREMTLDGTVKQFQWTNPHTWMQLVVKGPGGKEVEWSIEGASPNNLARFGWRPRSLKIGDRVQAVIHPLKDGSTGGSLVSVTVNGQAVGAAGRG